MLDACQQNDVPTEQPLRPVRYFSVAEDQVGRNRSFSGTSKSTQESRLSFKVPGTVTVSGHVYDIEKEELMQVEAPAPLRE